MPETFKFKLGQAVVVSKAGTPGQVRARAEYDNKSPSYNVEYVNGQGDLTNDWFEPQHLEDAGE